MRFFYAKTGTISLMTKYTIVQLRLFQFFIPELEDDNPNPTLSCGDACV